MLTAGRMHEIARSVEAVALRRLRSYSRSYNLVTYEGTVLDRLCHHFAKLAWQTEHYSILCSIRPCMDARLQTEVREFALLHGHPFVGYTGDCEVDKDRQRFVSVRCDNVSDAISAYLKGRNGLLVLSGLLNDWSHGHFQTINAEMGSFSALSRSLPVLTPGPKSNADWQTLFLFEGFYPIDILVTYFCTMSLSLEPHHIPTCYLSCHNEEQQESLKDRLDEIKRLAKSQV